MSVIMFWLWVGGMEGCTKNKGGYWLDRDGGTSEHILNSIKLAAKAELTAQHRRREVDG